MAVKIFMGLMHLNETEFCRVMAVNLAAPSQTLRLCFRELLAVGSRGNIINVLLTGDVEIGWWAASERPECCWTTGAVENHRIPLLFTPSLPVYV